MADLGIVDAFVERPIPSAITQFFGGIPRTFPQLRPRNQWCFKVIYKIWVAGYSVDSLVKIFDNFTPELQSVVLRALTELQARSDRKIKQLSSTTDLHRLDDPNALSYEDDIATSLEEARMWENECECGFMQVVLDPETQERRCVHLNARMGELLGFHREEMLARLANYEVEVPRPELDSLRVLLDDFSHVFDDDHDRPVERYYRIYR
eukprot:CAMPEP_0113691398 /NCGR_PEP_ID=MMETSP0038_2-20120614/18409_1 /TAXON_ID=2898 /ORGANISM="Cryptomonas paramecium" /LENGTH=207 /DNA_ID=CAMNT_0000612999 /DNA_START=161 /DNA_END=781 /DNA_ORIENTATION=- /assembly_acc=CAM_ASM_000170